VGVPAATSFTVLTPLGALVALALLIPLAGALLAERRVDAARKLLGLARPAGAAPRATLLALAAVPALLGLAAAQPALRSPDALRVRSDAEALFVLDTSRSMAAAARPGSTQRLARAQAAAVRIRSAIPSVPAGVGTLTDRVLPNLFATADPAAFDATVERTVGIERPPPQSAEVTATSLAALADVRTQGFFKPSARRRLLVVLTDGESRPYSPAAVGRALRAGTGVSLVLVRVSRPDERVYRPSGLPEVAYLSRPESRTELDELASAAGGRVFDEGELDAAIAATRSALGDGPTAARGLRSRTIALAPYVAALSLVPLLVLLLRRRA
jgi:hypothetical protein